MLQKLLSQVMKILKNKNLIFMVLAMLTTSIGMMGGFYKAPKSFMYLVEKFPIIQHILVFLLIYQGQGDEKIALSLVGTVATYLVVRLFYYLDDRYFPEPKPMQA